MERSNKPNKSATSANEAVEKAYHEIIGQVKYLLESFPTEALRTYVERKGTNNDSHSFYSPLVYISVADHYGKRMISFAKNPKVKPHIGPYLDTVIPRFIYSMTEVSRTQHNIEDRLEEYAYHYSKYDDALRYAETHENYKKDIVHPKQEA